MVKLPYIILPPPEDFKWSGERIPLGDWPKFVVLYGEGGIFVIGKKLVMQARNHD